MSEEIKLNELTKSEIIEALVEPAQPPVNTLVESAAELKKMGVRDISEANDKIAMDEALKNVQLTKILEDKDRHQSDAKSIRDYLEQHIKFIHSVSQGKTLGEIVQKMTVEHAQAVLTTTAKQSNVDDKIILKHLKTLKKKYN